MSRSILVSLTSDRQEFQVSQAAEAERVGRRLGIPVDVVYADENAVLQIHQLFERIKGPAEQRPLAFVVEPVKDEGLERLCRNALAAGIGWIPLNRAAPYLADLRQEYANLPICSIVTDQVEAGRIQGRQIRRLLPEGGTVLYIHGPAVSITEDRRRGTEEVIEGLGVRLQELSGTWTEASGEKAVRAWLRLKAATAERIDLLACQNDLMAAGGRRALLAARPDLTTIPVLGMDGLPSGGQQLVARRELTATVTMPANAGRAVEVIAEWERTGQQPSGQTRELPGSYPALEELISWTGR